MSSPNISYDDILQGIREWSTDPNNPPYDFNGVIHLLAAAIDNLRDNAMQSEIDEIAESLSSDQMNYLCLLANRCGRSEILRHCANDAVNIFVRDVLIPQELVDQNAYNTHEEIDKLRNETNEKAARLWQDARINHDT